LHNVPVHRLRTTVVAAVGAVTLAAVTLPAAAVTPPAGAAPVGQQHAPHGTAIRTYDQRLLARANHARERHQTASYAMNDKLWKVAHAWAQHMAHTGNLVHNPHLQGKLSRKCPQWSQIGENIAYAMNRSNKRMFRAYMHSPEHRANILNRHYHQVGIASVKVVRHHQVEEWNVMDFADRC
jgi:uncharacterized protein YkwD